MEYNKRSLLTKLILCVLSLSLLMTFVSCSSDKDSDQSGQIPEFTVKEAKELVRLDKLVTEIFICNALCPENSGASRVEAKSGSQYVKFSEIERLLNSVYLPDGGDKKFFLNYPEVGVKAVSEKDGKTLVFEHRGSGFEDFIDASTISVKKTDSETKRLIKAKTVSGKEVTLKAVCREGKWLLEHGIYHLSEKKMITEPFYMSNLGSMSSFTGDILVIELFVSDHESYFSKEDEALFHEKVKKAFDYISKESKRFDNNVTVSYESLYFDHDGTLGSKSLDFDIAFAETGFGTLKGFAEETLELSGYDNYVFVVCFNKEFKTDYNAYDGEKETEIYFAERVYIGNTSAEYEICSYALRLLGADDFRGDTYDEYTKKLFASYFPDEVLLKDTLDGASLSSVNAYACGIIKELDPIYRVFKNQKVKSEG